MRMGRQWLAALALLLLSAAPPQEARPAVADAALNEAVRRQALALLPAYERKGEAADLGTLYRLQLAAGRYAEAETTILRLQGLYRSQKSALAYSLVPLRIYVRAKRHQTEDALGPQAALERGFAEVYVSLSDKEAVDVLPWYNPDLDRWRQSLADARTACPGTDIASCAGALGLISAYESLAGWEFLLPRSVPLLDADMRRRFLVEDDLLIPMPDGAKIAAVMVRPRSSGRLTALMNFTIYAKEPWALSDAAKMAAYGYAGMVAYSRGKGRSPGPAVPYEHDGADAAAVIDWLARQPWSDGRVGMFSGSYNASTQWGAVKHRPKALKAIATNASNAPGIDTPMERNIFENFIYPWPLYTTTVKGLNDKLYFDPPRWAALNRNWYLSGRPYRELEKIDGQPNPVFAEWLKHPTYGPYWQRFVPYGAEFAKVDVPVLVVTGYFDGGMVGALYYLREHYKHNPRAEHRLLVGPYHHTAMTTGVLLNVSGYEIDKAARLDLQEVRLHWFEHVFRGAPLPELLSDRINFEVMGADRWRHVPSLASMGTATMRLYLDGREEGGRRLLSPAPPQKKASAELRVDLRDRRDVDYQAPVDVVARELDARNALVFATSPLDAPLEINGAFRGSLNVTINKKDFDLSVALYEQRADGAYFPLANFMGRTSYLEDRSHRRLLRPGKLERLSFESDRVTSRQLGKGSRIVAVVGVLKQPDYQINYGTGKDVSDESVADAGAPLVVRWRNDSHLDLLVWR